MKRSADSSKPIRSGISRSTSLRQAVGDARNRYCYCLLHGRVSNADRSDRAAGRGADPEATWPKLAASALRVPHSRIREIAEIAMSMDGVYKLYFGESNIPTPEFIKSAAARAMADGFTYYTENAGLAFAAASSERVLRADSRRRARSGERSW